MQASEDEMEMMDGLLLAGPQRFVFLTVLQASRLETETRETDSAWATTKLIEMDDGMMEKLMPKVAAYWQEYVFNPPDAVIEASTGQLRLPGFEMQS